MTDSGSNKVFVLGMDSLEPTLIFERYVDQLPNFKSLMDRATFGKLRSTDPPISSNAWISMTTGRGPEHLGIYDFVYRKDGTYTDLGVVTNRHIKDKQIWELVSEHGKKVCVANVPITYPVRPVNGCLVAGLLTPGTDCEFTYPSSLKDEILRMFPDYSYDIPNFRLMDRDALLKKIYRMTEMRYDLFEYLFETQEWDLFWGVIFATDRIAHTFWRYIDPEHVFYEANSPYSTAIVDYLKFVDERLGNLLQKLPSNTSVFIVSDHGAKSMRGRFNMNDWLRSEGYLVLAEDPGEKVQSITTAKVDWSKTRAFAMGAYFGYLHLNVRGRDPLGVVESGREGDLLIGEICEKLKRVEVEDGHSMACEFISFDKTEGKNRYAPDLLIYLDNLHMGVNPQVGNEGLISWRTELGPDDAVHSEYGLFIYQDPYCAHKGYVDPKDLKDVAPTIMRDLGLPIPDTFEGTVFN